MGVFCEVSASLGGSERRPKVPLGPLSTPNRAQPAGSGGLAPLRDLTSPRGHLGGVRSSGCWGSREQKAVASSGAAVRVGPSLGEGLGLGLAELVKRAGSQLLAGSLTLGKSFTSLRLGFSICKMG